MKLEPVKRYKTPRYPSYEYMLDHPELLKRVPVRWRGNKLVMTAVCALAMMANSCRNTDFLHKKTPIADDTYHPALTAGNMRIPEFITESEAHRIIRDEAAKSGIIFKSDLLSLTGVRIPMHFQYMNGKGDTVLYTNKLRLDLDGNEPRHKIAYKYIDQTEYHAWNTFNMDKENTAVDLYSTAQDLEQKLLKQYPQQHIGVFSVSTNEQDLRKQVDDFIKWLKAEGII